MDQSKPSLLFLTTDLPYPPNSGGRIKTFELLRFLSLHFDVKLICAFGGSRTSDIEGLRSAIKLAGFQAFTQHLKRNALNVFKAFMFSPTLNAHRIFKDEIVSMVNWSGKDVNVVLVDHLEAYHLMPEDFKGKVIYHSHNAEFKLWKEFAAFSSGLLTKWMLSWESKRVKALEKYAISKSVFTFIAPNDKESIQTEIGFKDDAFRKTLHLGNDRLLELPSIDITANQQRLFYAGTLSWEPNRDGIQWFIQSCWPVIKSNVPNAELNICGPHASESLKSIMRQAAGVNYLGFVDDLEATMALSRCAIVPLRFGSGMKIKSFDALYRGLPLITTTVGAEGIAIKHADHALITDDAEGLANAVISVLSNPADAVAMRDRARDLCKTSFTYPRLFEEMLTDIKAIL